MARIDSDAAPSEHVETLQKASAYRALAESDGYRRLLDFLESWANQALQNVRAASFSDDDRSRTNRQLIWAERENVIEEIQREVQRGIAAGQQLAAEIDPSELVHTRVPMEFSENE